MLSYMINHLHINYNNYIIIFIFSTHFNYIYIVYIELHPAVQIDTKYKTTYYVYIDLYITMYSLQVSSMFCIHNAYITILYYR